MAKKADPKAIVLNDCRVSRRGKKARGTVVIKTLGKPVKVEGSDVTKEWDYSLFTGMAINALVAVLKTLGVNVDLAEALARGVDVMQRSTTARSQSEIALLTSFILSKNLARDTDEAKGVAGEWIAVNARLTSVGDETYTIEELVELRQKTIARLKAAGLYGPLKSETAKTEPVKKAQTPRLVKTKAEKAPEPEPDEDEEDEDSEDLDVDTPEEDSDDIDTDEDNQ